MRNRILLTIILPVIVLGLLLVIIETQFLLPRLSGFIDRHTEASLTMAADLGIEKCTSSYNHLQALKLLNDPAAVTAWQRKTLTQISAIGQDLEKVHIMVVDDQGVPVKSMTDSGSEPRIELQRNGKNGFIGQQSVSGQPVHLVAHPFPSWRWYVVAYMLDKDAMSAVHIAGSVVYATHMIAILVMISAIAMIYRVRVGGPLKAIVRSAGVSAGNQAPETPAAGRDDIEKVSAVFRFMADNLDNQQRKFDEVMSALRESEEIYRVITENSLSQIVLVKNRHIIFANRRTLELTGFSWEELVGRPAIAHIHVDDQRTVRRLTRLRTLGRSSSGPVECRYFTKSGSEKWLELSVVPTQYKKQPVLLVYGIDITQRKKAYEEQQRLEAKLWQVQKMETIGTLAGGIAHDFNNLLMGIQGNISLLTLKGPKDQRTVERLQSIEQYVKNGADLTRQLLGYARGGKYEVKALRVNELVSESARMFGRTKKEIVMHLGLHADLWPVEADRSQIEQVLLNLYVNAWQAMPDGGEIDVTTSNVFLERGALKMFPKHDGDYILIQVRDNGVGMDEQILQKIFDPFFTTKQLGRGTGLGLASAYGIVKNHRGGIFCQSNPGRGTTFSVYLPKSDKDPSEEPLAGDVIRSGSETVLLVDDEQLVIEVAQELLETLGYQVVSASDGRQAIEIFKAGADHIDLVILDMVMPGMGGAAVFDAIKQIRPDIPILLCSGYSLEGQASEIMARGCDGFMQKPFEIKALSEHLRRILDARPH